MIYLLQPLQDLARGAAGKVRAALRQGALIGAALLVAMLGALFLILAGYLGLRVLLGPGLAAMVMGAGLLAMAAGLLLIARNAWLAVPPVSLAPNPQARPQATAPRPGDAATMAVFTAAFLLGRRLADRWEQFRNT